SLRAWPDEKTDPVAPRITAETSLRCATSSRAHVSCCINSMESALRLSGRSSVSVAMCSCESMSIFSIASYSNPPDGSECLSRHRLRIRPLQVAHCNARRAERDKYRNREDEGT